MSSTPSTSSSPPRPVKKENEEEIKEFAETAMNELLGWYGYERLELRRWAASRSRTKDASSPDQPNEQKDKEECSWCNKSLAGGEGGALQQAGATFCSELCFSQSRRANFKRAKTCDWCRHVRHTVAYVDFQDGATQLQFCSDKCLNQYKMHIFCRETQAHLDLHPHLAPPASAAPASLITPDLWLRNCRSRSVSPRSDRTPSPDTLKGTDKTPTEPKKSPLPLITIAPTAKLMKPKRPSEERAQIQKSPESKRNSKLNLRKRRTSKCSATVTSQTARHSFTPKAQDLRMCSPNRLDGPSPVSTIGSSALHSPTHPVNPIPPPFPNPLFGMPAPVFMDHPHGLLNDQRLPMFPPRPSYLPRGMPMPQERPRLPLPLNYPQHIGQTPPVTILVPYPVPVPIPLPIPIPMPMSAFLRAHLSGIHKVKTEARSEDNEGPLDFTMNGDKNKDEDANCAKNVKTHEVNDPVPDTNNEVNERVEPEDKTEESEIIVEAGNPEQTLPKFKITRLGNKMAKIVTKPREQPESTRPLRKRRRLVEVTTDDDPLIPKTRKIVQV